MDTALIRNDVLSCSKNKDVIECRLRVDLLNLQLLLKSPSTPGYLIVCADRTCLSLAQCQPVWRGEELLSKSTVTGDLIGMQYFSTVGRGQAEERWLPESIVRGNRVGLEDELKGCPDVVGAGPRVGGIVSDCVGSGDNLQRIVSRCRCDIRYVSYTPSDPSEMAHLSIIGSAAEDPVFTNEEGVTTFTLWHHTIAACANSQQWERAIDLIQNLLFYVEPKRKELMDRLQTLKWALFVKPPEQQRELILSDQEELRNLMQEQRNIEKDIYRLLKEAASPTKNDELRDLDAHAAAVKDKIQDRSAVLALRINVYQVTQLGRHGKRNQTKQERMIRRNEICFEDATCVLTKEAGQLDFAKVILKDFLYTRTFKADYSGAHHIELGYLQVQDTANGCVDVVSPTHWRRPSIPDNVSSVSGGGSVGGGGLDSQATTLSEASAKEEADAQQQPFLRVDCVELPPITGISVKQSLEVQIDRLKLNVTKSFYKEIKEFLFDTEAGGSGVGGSGGGGSGGGGSGTPSAPAAAAAQRLRGVAGGGGSGGGTAASASDMFETMRRRAAETHTFYSVRVFRVPIILSYKGEKDRSLINLTDYEILSPPIEISNKNYTWQDLAVDIKQRVSRDIIQQVLKQKLKIPRPFRDQTPFQPEREARPMSDQQKAVMIFGHKYAETARKGKSAAGATGKQMPLD